MDSFSDFPELSFAYNPYNWELIHNLKVYHKICSVKQFSQFTF